MSSYTIIFRRMPFLLLLGLSVAGCDTPRKTETAAADGGPACAEAWARVPDQPRMTWQHFRLGEKGLPAGYRLPTAYTAYRIPREELQTLFRFVRDRTNEPMQPMLAVPLPDGCRSFRVRTSATMTEDLQRRYPDLIALQGTGEEQKGDDLRLEWDGRQMHGQVLSQSRVYLISPVLYNKETIYLVYDKAHTGEVKQPFEAPPATTPKPNR